MIDILKTYKRTIPLCVMVFVMLFWGKVAWSAPQLPILQNVSVSKSGQTVTLALRYTPIVPYQMFGLYTTGRYRLVLDTHNTTIPSGVLKAGSVVKAVRSAHYKENIKRIVWEFGTNYRIVSQGYKNGVLYINLMGGKDETIFKSPSWGKVADTRKSSPSKQSFVPQKKSLNGIKVVVIDAGHGGHDPGAIGVSKAREKDINLKAAKALRDELQKMKGYKVILTRENDTFIELNDRYKIAERNNADLFISLHADKLSNPNVRGLSVYSMGYDSLTKRIEQLKHKHVQSKVNLPEDAKTASDPNIKSILVEASQKGVAHCSMKFAHSVEEYIKKRSPIKTLPTTTRYGGYAVLKSLRVPAVLVEMGFLSNRTDERILTTEKFRKQFAFYMARAIDDYMQKRGKIGCLY